jgi:hypothetical protein
VFDPEAPFAVFVRPGVHGVLTGKAYAQEFLLGAMIKAATKSLQRTSSMYVFGNSDGQPYTTITQFRRTSRQAWQVFSSRHQ